MKKIITSIFLLGAALSAQAQIFTDDFSAYTSGLDLSGQGDWTNNSSNPGGLGTCAGIACINTKVQDFSMSYPNYGTSAKAISIASEGDAVGKAFTAVTSGSMYIGFVINFSAAVNDPGGATSQDFFRVMSGGNYNTTFRMGAYNSGTGFKLFIQKGSGTKVYSADLSFNQDHLVFLKYTINPGTSDDVVSLIVNPDMTQTEPTTTITAADGTDYTQGPDRMNFRTNYSTIPTGHIGLVKALTQWPVMNTGSLSSLLNENHGMSVYSNAPSSLTIKSNESLRAVENVAIYTSTGKLIQQFSLDTEENELTIQTPELPNGIYFVNMQMQSGELVQVSTSVMK